ncbi:MAG: murein biosynthesis integral membrane protein MurJ [Planctomycetes bacterium]|nr:murein biosynthesis integral membrane protein MurJ [Planctomycetota bacterium]
MPVTAESPPSQQAAPSAAPGLISSARVVSACILLSRILGMARDILLAGLFGGGMVNDAFVLATLVPNLFRRLFGEGALTASFVPTYAEFVAQKPRAETDRFVRSALTMLALFLGTLAGIGMGVSALLGHHFADPKARLVCDLLVILLPYMPLICVVAIVTGILNVHRHFLLPALSSSVLNVFQIVAFFAAGWFAGSEGGKAVFIAWSITIAGLGQLLLQWPAMRAHKIPVAPLFKWEPGVGRVLATMLPMTLGVSVFQINVLIDNAMAEGLVPGSGAVSALYYANRLFQFPIALIGVAIAQTSFPEFADALARRRPGDMAASLNKAIRMTLFLGFPASLGLVQLASPICRLFFEHGSFGPEQTHRAATALACYGVAIWAACFQQVIVRAFYAAKDGRIPAITGALTVVANASLNLILVRTPLREAGLALSTSITTVAQIVILSFILRRRIPEVTWTPVLRFCIAPLVATGAMAAACWGIARFLPPNPIVQALVPVGAGIAAYLAIAAALGVPEARDVFAFRRRRAA